GVLGAEEPRQRRFELLVHGLRAADEAHRGHAVAEAVDGAVRRLAYGRVAREPEVIVSAEVDDLGIVGADLPGLWAGDHALGLEQALPVQFRQVGIESLIESGVHRVVHRVKRIERNYTGRRMRNPSESEELEGGEGGGTSLRVDRWLWCTRLFKSRTVAAEAVAGGKVHVNGRRVKPALAVKVGDHVTITRAGYEFECEVLRLPD